MLTDQEAVAVLLGLVAADRLGLSTEAPATGVALAKLHRVLPAVLAQQLAALQEALGFTLRRRDAVAPPASAILLELGTAIRERRRVSIRYRSWRERTSTRELDPYGVVFHSGRWFVTGYDHRSGEVRVFRLDRIASVEPGGTGFTPPDGFDPVGHVARSLAAVPYRWEVEVLLETDLASARARLPPTVGELVETASGVRLRARAERLDGMAVMLAGFGWPFTVVRPEELRQALVSHASALLGYAGRRIPDTEA